MSDRKRQMHLGVFVLGTGNHSAGWRWEGAFATSCSFPVMQEIARTAERGKFDLFFISDGLAMDPGDHPSFANRFEPLTLLSALSAVTTSKFPSWLAPFTVQATSFLSHPGAIDVLLPHHPSLNTLPPSTASSSSRVMLAAPGNIQRTTFCLVQSCAVTATLP